VRKSCGLNIDEIDTRIVTYYLNGPYEVLLVSLGLFGEKLKSFPPQIF